MNKPKLLKVHCVNHFRVSFDKNDIETEKFTESVIHYNEEGKIIREEQYIIGNELDYILTNEYNEKGKLASTSQYDGDKSLVQKTDFFYDKEDVLIQQDNYYGENSLAYTQKFEYENGLLTKLDAYEKGKFIFTEKKYFYNERNLLEKEIEYDEDGNEVYVTTLTYNQDGLLDTKEREEVMAKDLRVYEYEYDARQNKTKELIYNYEDVLIAKICYRYDEEGKLLEKEEEDLDHYQKMNYTYNGKNLCKIETFNQDEKMISWTEYTYDEQDTILSSIHYGIDEMDENAYRPRMEYHYERVY